jgi:predicted regulator of Ras-like GTPase activity (Roadblock/LC7/MglB family)
VTPFASILRRAVERTPNAIGSAFADSEGEMVDSFSTGDAFELAVMTAHYGVVMQHVVAAFGTWHYGGPEYLIADHSRLEVIVYNVNAGYYALIASEQPAPLAVALESLRSAARALKKEMGL